MSQELESLLYLQQDKCFEWLNFRNYSKETQRAYGVCLKRFRDWVTRKGHLKTLSDLSNRVITDFLVDLSLTVSTSKKPDEKDYGFLSASYRSSHVSALSLFFTHLFKQGLILTNPMHGIEHPIRSRVLPRTILTVDEMLRILSLIDTSERVGLRNRAALELLYTSGLRSGELERLNVSSINLRERMVLVDGKGKRQRYVPIGREAQRCLLEYLENGRPKFRADNSQALFLSITKGRMDIQSLRRVFKICARKSGIKKHVDLHCIRHTCATHMLANGADIRYIQVLLGHKSLKSTQVYTRVEISDLKKVLDSCHPRDKF